MYLSPLQKKKINIEVVFAQSFLQIYVTFFFKLIFSFFVNTGNAEIAKQKVSAILLWFSIFKSNLYSVRILK